MNDLKPFRHGEESTHSACPEMVRKLGGKVGCCSCNSHACKQAAPEGKSFFDYSPKEKQDIIEAATRESNRMQKEYMGKSRKQLTIDEAIQEFEEKFDHFNDAYIGHEQSFEDPDVGKQICDPICESMYDLEDVKALFRNTLDKAYTAGQQAAREEIANIET